MEENNKEKSLVKKGENSLKSRNVYMVKPILKTAAGIIFYIASFVVSIAIGYTFVFSVFD